MNKFMEIAVREAKIGIENGHGGPFGCVIVKNGTVIGQGHNEVLLQNDPTCHGEMTAIRDACKNIGSFDLSGCELYTTGEPCPMCMGAIQWARIQKVYYGCNVRDTARIGFDDEIFYSADRSRMLSCTDRDECLALYEEYMQKKGRQY